MNRRPILPLVLGTFVVLLGQSPVFGQCDDRKLQPLVLATGDRHGTAVAVDEFVAAVGSPRANNGGNNRGTVTVYRLFFGDWLEEDTLTPSDPANTDEFGAAVAVHGDTIVVGAPGKSTDGGAVYVFEHDGANWNQSAKLTSPSQFAEEFGTSVAMDRDVIVIGDPLDNQTGIDSGAALVFEKPVGGWADSSSAALLTSTNASSGDQFGVSVDIDANEIVVGASREDLVVGTDGAAYVFVEPVGGWVSMTQTATLSALVPQANAELGRAVAIDGGVVAAGAPPWNGTELGQGSVYMFRKSTGSWVDMNENQVLTALDEGQNDQFGFSVALEGSRLVVGAVGNQPAGNAYLFQDGGVFWTETFKYASPDFTGNDQLGTSVAASGTTVLLGAPAHHTPANFAGAAYVFDTASFHLEANSTSVQSGDPLTMTGCGGVPGGFSGLFVTHINGVPSFHTLLFSPYDAAGIVEYGGSVPTIPSPFTVTFVVIGNSVRNGGGPDVTNFLTISFSP